jgi:hypothetical protein
MVNRSLGGTVLLVACVLVIGCGVLDVPDHVRGYHASNRIRIGMALPTVFDELSRLRSTGDWHGLLVGFACDFHGEKQSWVLSRVESGYVVITHPDDAPSAGEGDRQLELSSPEGVHDFLAQRASASCKSYQATLGRWVLSLSLAPESGRVREVGPLMYHLGD